MRVRTVQKIPVKGRRVSPDALRDMDMASIKQTERIDEWLARRLLAGMHPKAVAVASDGRFSERTMYRWRKALIGLAEVEVEGYRATFAIRRNQAPARLTHWERAA